MLSIRDILYIQRHKYIETKGWTKRYTLLISDKTDFKIKIVTNNKGHFMMIKHQEDFIINTYNRDPKYMKQKLTELKGEI